MLRRMFEKLRQNDLNAWVFVTGALVLVIEIVAVRILAPFFGNTLFSVSSVLSVVLLALSVGYWVGGNIADKTPKRELFYTIILSSGVLVLGLEIFRVGILEYISGFTTIITGPLVSSVALFIGPALLLGMLSPLAIKIKIVENAETGVGRVTGGMFFWSTLGSISGSIAAGFFLIPAFGVDQIMLGVGITLVLLGASPLILRRAFTSLSLVLLVVGVVGLFFMAVLARPPIDESVLYSADGVYEKVTVSDGLYKDRPTRFLQQDRNSSAAMYLDSDELVYEYSKYYELYKLYDITLEETAVLGSGAYSIPKALLVEPDNPVVDVVDIEPTLEDLSKTYFRVPDSDRLITHTIDGRRFLKDSDKKYDLIFGDVFLNLLAIPSHFTTVEFFELAKDRLDEDGVYIANIIGDTFDVGASFTLSEMRTIRSVFPNSHFFGVRSAEQRSSQNIIVVARHGDVRVDMDFDALNRSPNPLFAELETKYIDTDEFDLNRHQLLTDNHAPVDYLSARQLNRRKLK